MRTDHLYIVGNGFDIFHGILSKYSDFGNYVKATDCELHDIIERYLGLQGNWADLEASLAWIDIDSLIDEASNFLVSYGADDWSDSYHHDYQYEITQIVEKLSTKLKQSFEVWVSGLPIPNPLIYFGQYLAIDPGKSFLTFNYTDTLFQLYGVPTNNTLHIHGTCGSGLVLGHAWQASERKSLNDVPNPEDMDTRVMEGNQIIDEYFEETFKNSSAILQANKDFFSGLHSIRKVTVLGHSLSDVDMPYLNEIAKNIDIGSVAWLVTYFGNNELNHHRAALQNLGVPSSMASFYEMAALIR